MASADTVNNTVPEWRLQEAAVCALDSYLRAHPGAFAYAAGLEGVRLRPRQRATMRAQGMTAGEPDLRFYLPSGKLMMIELKTSKGATSAVQKARHGVLRALGFAVHVVKAKTPEEAASAVLGLVCEALA
jgi:hypothetical protein